MVQFRTLLALAASLVALVTTTWAQDDHAATLDVVSIEDRKGYVKAVMEINEGKEEESLFKLREIGEQYPDDPDYFMLEYNVACALSRLGRTEEGLVALAKAIDGGYGLFGGQQRSLDEDPDLDTLRKVEGFTALRLRAAQLLADLRQRQLKAETFVYVPDRPAPPEGEEPSLLPLLIVLHPYGANPEAFATEHFQAFADSEGVVLLAPQGNELVSADHWAWFAGPGEFQKKFRRATQYVWELMNKTKRRHPIDPERIFVVGAGQGGSLAFALAARNPQWVRGGFVFGGALAPCTLAHWLRPSVHYGRRIAVIHGEQDPLFPYQRLADYAGLLVEAGLDLRLHAHAGSASIPDDLDARLKTGMAWMSEVAFQREPPSQEVMLDPGEPPVLPKAASKSEDGE